MDEPTPEQLEAWDLSQIKQQKSRLNAKPIGRMVRTLMARSGYGQTRSNEILMENYRQAVGEPLASHSRPGNISRGVLIVHVTDSSVLQELHLAAPKILKALQQAMPEANLRQLRGRVSRID